jgi:hypothetical protein
MIDVHNRTGGIMGFRFRKSIKILPGVRLNFSKSGFSTSIGVPGATINVSDRGTRGTVGVPGTGVSYTERIAPGRKLMTPAPAPTTGTSAATALGWVFVAVCFLVILSRLTG